MTTYGQYIAEAINEVLYDTTKDNIRNLILTIESNAREIEETELEEIVSHCYATWEYELNS